MITPLTMPRLGLTMEEGTLLSWLKKEGEPVRAGEPLLSVETDKVAIDVEAPASGVLLKIVVPEGATVPLETVIAYIGDPGEAIPEKSAAGAKGAIGAWEQGTAPITPSATVAPSAPPAPVPIKVSPIARKLAEEHGIDLAGVQGTGPQGRIVEADIRLILSGREKAPPEIAAAPAQAGQPQETPFTLQALSTIRRTTALRMSQSARTIPHFYLNIEINAAPLAALRHRLNQELEARLGIHLTYTDLLLRALAFILPKHPLLNAAYHSDSEIKIYQEVNPGVAISAAGHGLVVGVIHHANRMSLVEIAGRRQELAAKAQARRLSPQDISGGTFTLTNLGMYGVDDFAPIINPGQSAILAAGAIAERPWGEAGQLVLRPTLRLTLAVDHRVADGADGALFLKDLRAMLEAPDELAR